MLCLDANVLLRCIVHDDPVQTPKALAYLKRAMQAKEELYVPDVIVMEVAWVLLKRYGYTPAQVSGALEPLVLEENIRFDNAPRLLRALGLFSAKGLGIVDAYLASAVMESKQAKLVTFDRQLKKFGLACVEP